MKYLRIIINTFWYPILIIHEFSHAIMALFVFKRMCGITFKFVIHRPLSGAVFFKDTLETGLRTFLISLAPLFTYIACICLAFYYPFFIYVVIYQTLAYSYTLPSGTDINQAFHIRTKNYKKDKAIFKWLFPEWENEELTIQLQELMSEQTQYDSDSFEYDDIQCRIEEIYELLYK